MNFFVMLVQVVLVRERLAISLAFVLILRFVLALGLLGWSFLVVDGLVMTV